MNDPRLFAMNQKLQAYLLAYGLDRKLAGDDGCQVNLAGEERDASQSFASKEQVS